MSGKATADLYDAHGEALRVAAPIFRDFGGMRCFEGLVSTVRVFEDNSLVRAALEARGGGRVLVVDGGGSLRTALLGDLLALKALDHGWSGITINGSVRDSEELATMPFGVLALGTTPRRSAKEGWGYRDRPVQFLGVTIRPGAWICADADGWVIAPAPLQPQGE